ncbi:MAG: ABC transporter substrate-binding protein [Acidobacteria bacterium]|nr:ABC transporter substrate-binding protein [Acidobacteriota bacterium]
MGIVGALSAFACQGSSPPPPPPGPITLTIGVPQSRQLDPSHGIEALEWVTTERLTTNDSSGRTKPLLLEGWSLSADGLVWSLHVRSGVRFQDGSSLSSADVKRTIDAIVANPAARALSACVGDIRSVETTGERDVVVTLSRRCSYLLDDLDSPVTRTAADGRTRIGTGPFAKVASSADTITLEANRNYYLGRPPIDRVVLRSYDTLRTAWAEMMRGRVDFLWEVGPDTAELLSDQSSVDVRTFLSYYAYAVLLNSTRPALRDARVRRAINIAINREALVQQGLRGKGLPANGLIWPKHWARDGSIPGFVYDPEAATRLLRGEASDVQATRAAALRSTPPLEFTCLVPANFAILERLALLVQRQLGDVGVRMHLESIAPSAMMGRLDRGDYDAIVLPLVGGPYATIPYRFWHSAGPSRRWNYWGYANGAVDAALDAMRDARDDQHFREAMTSFETAVRDDPPAVFLAWSQTVQASSRRFEVPRDGDGRDALYVLNRWQLRAPGGMAQ